MTSEAAASAERHIGAAAVRLGWLGFLVLNALVCLVYFLWDERWPQAILYEIPLLTAVAALLVPASRAATWRTDGWRWLSLSMLTQVVGDVVYDVVSHVSTRDVAVPAAPDVFYVASSAMLIVGVWLLVRSHGATGDLEGAMDGLMLALALIIVTVGPFADHNHAADRSYADIVMSGLYPLLDIIAVSIAARLYIIRQRVETIPALLLIAGIVATMAGDIEYSWAGSSTYTVDSIVNSTWMLQATLIGAAALHPAARGMSTKQPRALRVTRGRLILIGVSLLALPLDPGEFGTHSDGDLESVSRAVARVLLVGLALTRIWLYGKRSRTSAELLVERERELSAQAVELEGARVSDLERQRIGEDLGTRVVQRLFSAGMQVQATVSSVSDPGVRDRMRQAVAEIDGAIFELRSAVYDVPPKPAAVDDERRPTPD